MVWGTAKATGDQALPTGVCMVLSGKDDRAFCSHFGVADHFDAAQLTARGGAGLRRVQPPVGHVHCAGFYSCAALRKSLPELLACARTLGATVSLDTNHDATGGWGDVDGLWDTLLPLVDLFMPNEQEACAIAKTEDLDAALCCLTKQVRGAVVVTRGAMGVVVAQRGLATLRVPAPAVTAVDPVGAGDAFKAGFLSRFVAGEPLEAAALYGCASGALCVTKRGACGNPPTQAELVAFGLAVGAELPEPDTDLLAVRRFEGFELLGDAFPPREARLLWWGFCLLWLGGTWPYQATLQAQAYYAASLPELSFLILMTFTWPLLASHLVQVLSGAAQAAGFSRRVFAAFCLNALVGTAFLAQDRMDLAIDARRATMMVLAALVALAQVLLEPALFGLAAALPSGSSTQAMMVGNASAGVVVVLVSILTRAGGGSDPSQQALHAAAQSFFGLQVAYSLASIALFLYMLRHSPRLAAAAASRPAPAAAPRSVRAVCGALVRAGRAVWMPAGCQFLVFGVTLAAWPSIPGSACLYGPFNELGQGGWFTLVVATYNVLDFAARLHLPRLEHAARNVSASTLLLACLGRLLLPPLIYICVRPRLIPGAAGNVVALLLVAVLALSNGFLATASMMQVAKLAPPGLNEEAVYVAMVGVYFGLASGATLSFVLAQHVFSLPTLHCEGQSGF